MSQSSSPAHRTFELAAILTFVTFAILNAWKLWVALDGPASWLVATAALIAGYILADFISGTVHWLADRYGSPETPVLGPNFIGPFRDHHVRPKDITTHDFIETNGNNCIVSFWLLVVAYFWYPVERGALGPTFALATVLFSMVAIMATNQFHKWAHTDDPPRFVRALQRLHLVLPADHHDVHHTAPFDTYFCITTGWLNWPLQKLRFYESVEWLVYRVAGIRAGIDDAVRTGLTLPPAPETPMPAPAPAVEK
jgi:ubiquitin-conjugating enzyme E2 variant